MKYIQEETEKLFKLNVFYTYEESFQEPSK